MFLVLFAFWSIQIQLRTLILILIVKLGVEIQFRNSVSKNICIVNANNTRGDCKKFWVGDVFRVS